jgi:hypothetical protein
VQPHAHKAWFAASQSFSAHDRQVREARDRVRHSRDPANSAVVRIRPARRAPVFHRVQEWAELVQAFRLRAQDGLRDAPALQRDVPGSATSKVLKKDR